jgi:hypothetical protein
MTRRCQKIYSLNPTVEEWNGKLWGVMVAEFYGELTKAETAKLLEFAAGQMSDGWGEGFEQRSIGRCLSRRRLFLLPERSLKPWTQM